ncbi:hypothetical protein LC593_35445 [Nostoc sp. CHAB 5844]|nr:hypothetical protein [Nostoc sp. CHAB 5844]
MKMCLVNSKILRQLWAVVEQTQSSTLLGLSDPDLVKLLLGQIESNKVLNYEETRSLTDYILTRTLLIRDLAQARLAS